MSLLRKTFMLLILSSFSVCADNAERTIPKLTSSSYKKLQNQTLIANPHWYDKITLSGLIRVGGYFSNHTPTTIGNIPPNIGESPSASDINIPLAIFTGKAKLSDWSYGQLAFAYAQRSPSFIRSPAGGGEVLFVDNAFLLFEKPDASPWYFKAGRYFIDFGGLDSLSITESTVQLLSLTRSTQASVGLRNWNGLSTSLYVFRPSLTQFDSKNTTRSNVVGFDFSVMKKTNLAELKVGFGVVSNMVGALYTSSTVANNSRFIQGLYTDSVAGIDFNGMIKIMAFDASFNYVSALDAFSVYDIPYTTDGGLHFRGAKPSAYGVNFGYTFNIKDNKTRIGLGYQGSEEAVALGRAPGSIAYVKGGVYGNFFAIGMPKSRIYGNYTIYDIYHVDLGLELLGDDNYSYNNGGTGRGSVTGIVMLATKLD